MLFEIGSTILMGGLAGWAYLKQSGPATNDAEKIQRIFANNGMTIKDRGKVKTIRLHTKRSFEGGMEYVYQLPLGMSSKQIMDARHILEDGLNIRHDFVEFEPSDLLKLKLDLTIIQQIRDMLQPKKGMKEIEIDFDGMLKIRVYNEQLTDYLAWSDDYFSTGLRVPVGKSRKKFIYHDFKEAPHMLIAGGTGFGKSQYLKMIVTTLVRTQPEHTNLSLIDLKGGTSFQRFADLKQVKHYGRNPIEARGVLLQFQKEMDAMLDRIVDGGYEDVEEAGIKDRHFMIVDEAADISGDNVAMGIVADIARRGRGAGYHLIYCTQYPTNETIPSQVRPNISARVCFKLKTQIQSRAVLDEGGAEELPEIKGRAIYQLNHNITLQTPYMTNEEINIRITPFKRKDGEIESENSSQTATDRRGVVQFERV